MNVNFTVFIDKILSGRDGFDGVRDFFLFFYNTYIERELEMVVIRWKDFKEAE